MLNSHGRENPCPAEHVDPNIKPQKMIATIIHDLISAESFNQKDSQNRNDSDDHGKKFNETQIFNCSKAIKKNQDTKSAKSIGRCSPLVGDLSPHQRFQLIIKFPGHAKYYEGSLCGLIMILFSDKNSSFGDPVYARSYTAFMGYPAHLYFNEKFRIDLDWKNQFKLRLGTLSPENRVQLSKSLKDLSHESIRNRFMGSKKEFSEKELEYLTNIDGWNHYAIGIEEREKACRGVAIARLVRSSTDPLEAEIAITIIDEYQKCGLGSLLMKMIGLAASERKLERLSFTFLPQNEAIIKLIHRLGPTYPVGHPDMDYVQLMMDIQDINLSEIRKSVEAKVPGLQIKTI